MKLTILIAWMVGMTTGFVVIRWKAKQHVQTKLALRKLIAEMYHEHLLPEICRAEGLMDLSIRETNNELARMALKEIKEHKKKVLAMINKYQDYQK